MTILADLTSPQVSTTIQLSPLAISVISGAVIPIVTGIITKLKAADSVKAGVALALSTIVGVLAVVVKENPITAQSLILCIAAAFTTNLVAYQGGYKPIGKTGHPLFSIASANFGLGKPEAPLVVEPKIGPVPIPPGVVVPPADPPS